MPVLNWFVGLVAVASESCVPKGASARDATMHKPAIVLNEVDFVLLINFFIVVNYSFFEVPCFVYLKLVFLFV